MTKTKQHLAAPTPPEKGKRRAATLDPNAGKRLGPELRWQRTQRFNWDKGGSRGGRR